MNVIIIQPPLVQLNTAYPAGAYLAAFFRRESCNATWYDLSIELFHTLFSSKGLSLLFAKSAGKALACAEQAQERGDDATASNIYRYISQRRRWISWIDAIVAILQDAGTVSGRELCHRFVFSPYAPRGMRMELFLDGLGREPTTDDARFLAEVFLYAVNRPNKRVDDIVEYEDAPLLAEANYECPLCHKKLVDMVKGQAVKRYRITQIFPDDLDPDTAAKFNAVYAAPKRLDVPDNLIALHEECSDRYLLSPTVEEYKKLREIKEEIARNFAAKLAVNSIQLEDDIRTVLDALSQIRDASELVQLEYDALHIDEKFEPENFILKNETQLQVVMYYRYIEKVFSESDADFDMIAAEIKISSQKLEKAGLSQPDVVAQLSEWIQNKAGLSSDRKLACNIVVSFFIQNCEVFHK